LKCHVAIIAEKNRYLNMFKKELDRNEEILRDLKFCMDLINDKLFMKEDKMEYIQSVMFRKLLNKYEAD